MAYDGPKTAEEWRQEYLVAMQTIVETAKERDVALARIATLDAAVRRYIDHHGQTADHHPDDCPIEGGCEACRTDAAVNAALETR